MALAVFGLMANRCHLRAGHARVQIVWWSKTVRSLFTVAHRCVTHLSGFRVGTTWAHRPYTFSFSFCGLLFSGGVFVLGSDWCIFACQVVMSCFSCVGTFGVSLHC